MLALRKFTQLFRLPQLGNPFTWDGSRRDLKVAVVGAGGGIGQPLSLLLKLNPHIEKLVLHDMQHTVGVAADLSHINTPATVCAFEGKDGKVLRKAIDKADIVVIPAGQPRKPGMSRSDLLDANASVAASISFAASEVCPCAFLVFITNPINTIVPIAATILRSKGTFDPNRLFGVTSLDVVRASTFVGDALNVNPTKVHLPVIGGHAGTTILPLLSQCDPPYKGTDEEREALVLRIQEAGTEVVEAKKGQGSATLSMAYAANKFVSSLIKAIKGKDDEPIVECAYVQSEVTEAQFFATPLILGPQGVKENLGLPNMDEGETKKLEEMLPVLKANIKAGIKLGEDLAGNA